MRGGFEFNHHFDENWQIRAAFAEIRSEQHSKFVQGFTLEADGQTLDRDETARHEASKNLTAQVELSGKFSTGPIEHHVLLGVEPSQYQFRYDIGDLPFAPINIFNPDYSPQLTDIPYAPRNTYGAEILGVYLMDQVTLLPNLKMLVAGRYDYVDTVEDYNPAPIMNHVNEALSPNVGLVYQPWEPISLYGSWATAFNPNFGLSRTGEHFAPERSQQIEAGIKGEFFNKRLSTTTAVYQIDKQNVLATDPTDPDFEILAGKVRSQGLEEDLIGQPIDGLRIIGSYAHTDAHVKADSTIPVGDHLAGIPAEQLGLWTSYQIQGGTLKGLGVGFGAYYLSRVQATLPNNGVTLPNYWRLDSSLFYQRDHWKAQLNFKNMTDKTYYASQGYEITPQPHFTVIFSLSTKF